jgi:glutamate racemase
VAVIGIFDSGSGGLSVLKEIRKVLPSGHFIYYADNAHCPYGEKSQDYIRDRARAVTRLLLDKGSELIVVACNTATGAAIAALREEFDVPFVGMEPAVKPAALGTRSGVIGVLATAGTLKASKYLNTKGLYQDNVRIEEHVGEGFVQLVERGELDGPEAERTVRASLQPLLDAGADIIVLGCTHYPFLRPVIERIAGPDVRIIDPAPAVARQVLRVLESRSADADPASPGNPPEGTLELLSSGDPATLHALASLI